MASPLAKQWQQLKLTDEEEEIIACDEQMEEEFEMKAALAIAGKYHSKTSAKIQSLRYFLKTAWSKIRKGFSIREMGDNMFIFQFFTKEDKDMVMKGGPWVYERHLLTLAEIRGTEEIHDLDFNKVAFWVRAYGLPLNKFNKRTAELIGGKFGGLKDFKEGDVLGWSKYLRLKVVIDIRKPLRRGVIMAFEEGNTKWVALKYEKLPLFCFGCGRIGHMDEECAEGDSEKNQYGETLRATPEKGLKLTSEEKEKEESLISELRGKKGGDRITKKIRYVGRLYVKSTGKPADILTKLNEMAGFTPDEEIELFEEIKFEPCVMCEHLDKRTSFKLSQIEDGDVICFQKTPPDERYHYPDVPSFLEYVKNRQVVHFRSLEKPKEDDFSLELSKIHTYDDVVERVAKKVGLEDPSKIRLTSHNCYSQQPKPQPIKYRGVDHLTDMLVHYSQSSDILYYEVLDIPLPELQGLKNLKVAFHHELKDEVVIHNIRLPKQSTVGDVINELKTKVELSHPDAELRLLEVFYHKIYKIFPPTEKIENINDQYWTLRAEEILEEEKNLEPNDRLIHVYHFTKDTAQNQMQVQNFGEPFFLVIHEDETLGEIKARIQKKLRVPDEEFSKWKFAFMSLGRPEYLQDSDIVYSRFQRRDVYGAWEQYLGLEHTDTTPKRAYTANQNRHTFEKPVKIYN